MCCHGRELSSDLGPPRFGGFERALAASSSTQNRPGIRLPRRSCRCQTSRLALGPLGLLRKPRRLHMFERRARRTHGRPPLQPPAACRAVGPASNAVAVTPSNCATSRVTTIRALGRRGDRSADTCVAIALPAPHARQHGDRPRLRPVHGQTKHRACQSTPPRPCGSAWPGAHVAPENGGRLHAADLLRHVPLATHYLPRLLESRRPQVAQPEG